MEQTEVNIKGIVQEVFYRAFVKTNAVMLGLKGWVRNETDGSVTAVFQGEPDKINEMLEKCKSGSPAARVAKISIKNKSEAVEKFDGFEIIG